ncbi:MAG: FAD-dependent oxidoreductase [Desulfobacteraceae bacterium]|nr:FAD-dependent oxidoreductase [Desulfobacteraceae bacterium]
MSHSKYLVVGSSHAGLSAVEAIRLIDEKSPLTLVSREETLPYSPTILPYVISGLANPKEIHLRGEAELNVLGVTFKRGAEVTSVNPAAQTVSLASGEGLSYERLLLATGAEPVLPPIAGLREVPYYVLRTLEDAMRLRRAVERAGSAVVLGAGLVGMHAAESMARCGIRVTVVEALPRVLPGYFDGKAAGLIQKVFTGQGIRILHGSAVTRVTASNGACVASLASGKDLSADLLLVATGVKSRIGYLAESGVEVDEGIVVDDNMRTRVGGIWAAGDVAQARGFFNSAKRVIATLPSAVEQGRIVGMDMVGDSSLKPYNGGISLNTYRFFGHRAFCAGLSTVSRSTEDMEVNEVFLPTGLRYQKLVFQDDLLVGVASINTELDPGIMCQLIRGRVDLGKIKGRFAAAPLETGRILMSRIWG